MCWRRRFGTAFAIVAMLVNVDGCDPFGKEVGSLSAKAEGNSDEGSADGLVTNVGGGYHCLDYVFSVDNNTATYGSDVNFTLRVRNSCDFVVSAREGHPSARMCVITSGAQTSLCGQKDGVIYSTWLPRDGYSTENEMTLNPGEVASVTLPWDSHGYRDLNEMAAPEGRYDVYAKGLGSRYFGDDLFDSHLTIKVAK